MKIYFREITLSLTFLIFFASYDKTFAQAVSAGSPLTKVHSGTVVSVWQANDANNNFIIQAAIGSVSTAPSTWSVTDLSAPFSPSTIFYTPHLFSNANGDIVILFQYMDSNSNIQEAACMLPVGTTTWNIATISNINETAGFSDGFASIDESGNVVATWTGYDPVLNINEIKVSTSVIGPTSVWSIPVTLAP